METTAKRRAEPTGDLFSILVNAEVDGQRMSDDEIVFETLPDPHRRRRDHPAHPDRWHRATPAPPESVGAPDRR